MTPEALRAAIRASLLMADTPEDRHEVYPVRKRKPKLHCHRFHVPEVHEIERRP